MCTVRTQSDRAVTSNLELISLTTGYGNTHNNSIHINSSSVDTQIKG